MFSRTTIILTVNSPFLGFLKLFWLITILSMALFVGMGVSSIMEARQDPPHVLAIPFSPPLAVKKIDSSSRIPFSYNTTTYNRKGLFAHDKWSKLHVDMEDH